jgi:hypothetical protein
MHGPEGVYGVGADDTLCLLGYGELQMVPALNHHSVPHLKNCQFVFYEAWRSEPVFLNLLRSSGIDSQPDGIDYSWAPETFTNSGALDLSQEAKV